MKWIIPIILVAIVIGVYFYNNANQFKLSKGDTQILEPMSTNPNSNVSTSDRKILITDGVKHSVPLNEILSGGPAKDGIPSIDNPKFYQ